MSSSNHDDYVEDGDDVSQSGDQINPKPTSALLSSFIRRVEEN